MPVQIANPQVVAKIERICAMTGLGKTAVVDAALDRMLADIGSRGVDDAWQGIDAVLAQFDRVPDRPDAFDPLDWDEHGLPR